MENILLLIFVSFSLCSWSQSLDKKAIDISGKWSIQLDSTDIGLKNGWQNTVFNQIINLPGTTDDFGIGVANKLKPALTRPQLSHLTRKNSYLVIAFFHQAIFATLCMN